MSSKLQASQKCIIFVSSSHTCSGFPELGPCPGEKVRRCRMPSFTCAPWMRWLVALVAPLLWLLSPRPAHAWVESHQTAGDVHLRVEPNGTATVEHTLTYRVVRGPLRSFDLAGIEKDAVPEGTATVVSESGRELTASVERKNDRTIRVTVDEPRSFMRGTFVFKVRYRLDLVAQRELVRDGAAWRMAWTAPTANEGYD